MPGRISRRDAMGLLGAGGLAGAVVSSVGGVEGGLGAPADGVAEALRPGMAFGRWVIAAVHPASRGAVRVDVRDVREQGGRAFALEIMARDASPLAAKPPAQTGGLAIYVCNGGDGFLPTVEEQGLAAMTLAHLLETQGRGGPIAGLLTHADRIVAHGDLLVGTYSKV